MSEAQPRNSVKRACDACKVRKIRCSNTTPCTCCVTVGIPCTFNKTPSTRGPRKLRAKTIQQIYESQRAGDRLDGTDERAERLQVTSPPLPSGNRSVTGSSHGNGSVNGARMPLLPVPRIPSILETGIGMARPSLPVTEKPLPPLVASPSAGFAASPPAPRSGINSIVTPEATLVLQLCVYRVRMFPVWPIVAVEDLMIALQKNKDDLDSYALANAVGAATSAQLKIHPQRNSAEVVTAESMEAEVQRIRLLIPMKLNNNRLRTSFFLHVYHENLQAGGINSLLYLREAITMAQMMGMHRESSYERLPAEEQQFRRRVLWLLFVTERGIALMHKLPVVLRSDIAFPAMEYDEEVSILPAFRKLVNLFWIFDQSGAFDILQSSGGNSSPQAASKTNILTLLQKRLQDIPIDSGATNEVQAADICVTRAWMRAVLWQMMMSRVSRGPAPSQDLEISLEYPTQIAQEFLSVISNLSTSAIEAHGPSMELKLYEIAHAVIVSISRAGVNHITYEGTTAHEVLERLQRILSSCRGGNTHLVQLLHDQIINLRSSQPSPHFDSETSNNAIHNLDTMHPQLSHNDENAGLRSEASSHDIESSSFAQSPNSQMQQQFATFPWHALAEENGMPGFHGSFDNMDSSAVLDRFIENNVGDNWSISRGTASPVSQWL